MAECLKYSIIPGVAILLASAPSYADMEKEACDAAPAKNTYEVLRKSKKIGSHEICFMERGNDLIVTAETKMKVKFLFFTAYKYTYVSNEVWSDGELISVTTNVNDNGKKIATQAIRDENSFTASNAKDSTEITANFVTTNHWNIAAAEQTQLFNTITGKLNQVSISEQQNSDTQTEYKIEGQLNINTRYDPEGNWLGMTFKHKDGSEIEFRCVDCTNTPQVKIS